MQANSKGVWTTTVGLKVLMAVSGLVLAVFVLFHMAGNLQIFLGREAYNDYAAFMQNLGGLLWLARLILLGMLAAHVISAMKLAGRNRAARPVRYDSWRARATTPHARLMLLTGIVVLLYIVYHVLHFTAEVVHHDLVDLTDPTGRRDVYNAFVSSFQNPAITTVYVLANIALASHLAHAMSSIFRTLGLAVGKWRKPLMSVGPIYGAVVGIGNVLMPLACLFGIVETQGI